MTFFHRSACTSKADIAILGCRGIPARYGGFETFAEELATRLAIKGFRVTVYAEAEMRGQQDVVHSGVTVCHQWWPRWFGQSVGTVLYDISCIWHARRRFHVVYMLGYGAAWVCWLPRLYGTQVWINPDGLEWARSKWGALVRRYFRLMEWMTPRVASRVIADSQVIARRMEQVARANGSTPIQYIAYGANFPREPFSARGTLVHQLGLGGEEYHLVVARLEPENQILEIVTGFSRLVDQVRLVIVGALSQTNRYHRQLLDVAGSGVQFIGAVYDREALEALRCGAKAYIHGHTVGGTNPSLLEAMACGNVVIAHDNPFNRETLGEAALYFSNSETLAQCVSEVEHMDDPTRQCFQTAVRAMVDSRFNWAAVADCYAQELGRVTGRAQ